MEEEMRRICLMASPAVSWGWPRKNGDLIVDLFLCVLGMMRWAMDGRMALMVGVEIEEFVARRRGGLGCVLRRYQFNCAADA